MILFNKGITKTPIRLHECAEWSAPLLFATTDVRFSHAEAHIIYGLSKKKCDLPICMGTVLHWRSQDLCFCKNYVPLSFSDFFYHMINGIFPQVYGRRGRKKALKMTS